jgi:hypothetical protein
MATILDIGIDSANMGVYHPKMKNRWKVVFYQPGISSATNSDASVRDAFTMQCTKFDRPKVSMEEVQLHRYNSVVKVAQSKYSFGDINMTIEDDVTNNAAKKLQGLFENQQMLIGQRSNPLMRTARTASEYKFGCSFQMLDGGDDYVEQWNLSGCWFKNIDWGDMDYSDGGIVTISITLSIDHAQQIFGNLLTSNGQSSNSAIGGL